MPSSERPLPDQTSAEWLSSTEARMLLKISCCTLAHLRLDGQLRFERRRNAFFYRREDCSNVLLTTGSHGGSLGDKARK